MQWAELVCQFILLLSGVSCNINTSLNNGEAAAHNTLDQWCSDPGTRSQTWDHTAPVSEEVRSDWEQVVVWWGIMWILHCDGVQTEWRHSGGGDHDSVSGRVMFVMLIINQSINYLRFPWSRVTGLMWPRWRVWAPLEVTSFTQSRMLCTRVTGHSVASVLQAC